MDILKTENICRVCLEDQEELFSLVSSRFECGDLCKIIQDVSGVIVSVFLIIFKIFNIFFLRSIKQNQNFL